MIFCWAETPTFRCKSSKKLNGISNVVNQVKGAATASAVAVLAAMAMAAASRKRAYAYA